MKIKNIICRMLKMCPAAWSIYIRTMQLCCVLLILSAFILIQCDSAAWSYERYMLAMGLYELPQALLLVSLIGSVCVEDLQS